MRAATQSKSRASLPIATRMLESDASFLAGMPMEVLTMIAKCLPGRDLNKLGRTCKLSNGVVLPVLYEHLVLKVPSTWSRLSSVEQILDSASLGLQFTTSISVETQSSALSVSQHRDDADDLSEVFGAGDDETSDIPRLQSPNMLDSGNLNSLLRILIGRVPQNRLRAFRINHNCFLTVATIETLYTRHRASLRKLQIDKVVNETPQKCHLATALRKFRMGEHPEGLPFLFAPVPIFETLHLTSLAALETENHSWAADLLVRHHRSLRHLQLGIERSIVEIYTRDESPWDLGSQSVSQAIHKHIEHAFSACSGPNEANCFALDTLSLAGLDLGGVFNEKSRYLPGLSELTALVLESCSGVSQTFQHLLGPQALRVQPTRLKLRSFTLRAECDRNQINNFKADLEAFLCSFQGLERLEILLEGSLVAQDISAILKAHGKTLKILIWDERAIRRTGTKHDISIRPRKLLLRTVSAACPNLISLGLALNWKSWTASTQYQFKMAHYLLKMPKLKTFNIRNMPSSESVDAGRSWLPLEVMYHSLASLFVQSIFKELRRGQRMPLETIGLGALVYGDVKIGRSRLMSDSVLDYLRLRVYRIDTYPDPQTIGALTPSLRLVAKGADHHELDDRTDMTVFERYWLG